MRESRSSGRRRLTARLAALLLTLAAALALLLPGGVGQAQTAASLIEVQGGGIRIGFEGERALGIETAASAGAAYDGWLVTEVELRIRPDDPTGVIRTATPPGLAICESDADGNPDGTCYPLIAPGAVEIPTAMTTGQEVAYATPGSGYFLTAGVNYTLHFTENGSTHPDDVHFLDASSNDGEVTSVAGTFRHAMRKLESDSTWALSTTNIAWARITGYASITPPGGQVLISNIEQSQEPGVRFGGASGKDGAQGFTTGTDPGGYSLTGIQLRLGTDTTTGTTTPTVKLLRGSPTGAEVAAFSGPASLVAGPRTRQYTFTPSAAVTLSPSTRYVLVAEGGGSRWSSAASLTPDGAPGHGWAFDGVFKERAHDSTGDFSQSSATGALKVGIHGTVNPPPPLISNVGKAGDTSTSLGFSDHAQAFTTGPHPSGYELDSIDLPLDIEATVRLLLVTLHSGAANGPKVADFAPQASGRGVGTYRFTPTTEVTLSASTSYWVVASDYGAEADWLSTRDSAYDDAVAPGWSFADLAQFRDFDETGPFTTFTGGPTHRLLIRVNGVLAPPVLLVNNTGEYSDDSIQVGSVNDVAQQFTTGANPGGYTLTGVALTLVATVGAVPPTVTLHSGSGNGAKVADFNGPASVPLDYSVQTFTPTTAVTLSASTDYWVVMQGGSDDMAWADTVGNSEFTVGGWTIADVIQSRSASSTGSFTDVSNGHAGLLGIYGRITPPANAAATGGLTTTVPNVLRVPALLTADISGIADANGIVRITDRARYRWQRFAADGTTLEEANIGTGAAYRLTDDDVGKRLKVSFSFTDDAGYTEGPLTSAVTDAVTAEAACTLPVFVGGIEYVWDGHVVIGRGAQSSYGFNDSVGSILGVPTFRTVVGDNTHEILSMVTSSNNLVVGIDTALSAEDKNKLVLHVCGKAFRFSSATGSTSFLFANTGVDWSGHAERYVVLSQDTAGPTLTSATVNGTSLVMTFDEELGAAASLANGAFTVKKTPSGGAETTLTLSSTAPSISGSTVTLTLATASAVTATDEDVKVLYTKPTTGTANKLVDTFGNEADTFTADQDVGNALADSVPPELSSDPPRILISNIGQVSSNMPSASQSAQPFRTGANPGGYTVASIEMQINGSSATIPAVTLRSGSASGTIVGTPATPGSAPIAGVLTYTFGTPVPLQASTPYWVVTGVAGSGDQWWVAAVASTDATTASGWTLPGKAQQWSGSSFVDFVGSAYFKLRINGVRVDSAVTDAAVLAADGLTLTLTYNEALKTASVPAAAAFTVKATPAGGSEAALALASSDAVTVSGSTVVLKLAVPIAHNDGFVKVSYAKPATGAVIEDANGNDAADFDRAVTNNSTVPRVSIERLYADASPGIANPAFRVRRSNSGGALTVNIGITQAAAYLATTQTITIPAGDRAATAWFTSDYMGNTSGDLTATVSGGNDHLPAVAPDNSATVRMKVPASGPTVWVSHEHLSLTVNEDGGTADMGVVFSTGAGVAKPRVGEITVAAFTDQGTASINRDYRHLSKYLPVGAGDWRAVAGGSYSHTEPFSITILDDDQYEPTDETFIVWLDSAPGVTFVLDIPGRIDPDGSATVTIVDNTPDTLKVSSVEVTSTPTAGYYGATDTIDFTVTFTGNVTVTGAPQFAFDLGGTTRQVAYASGSDSQELVFSHTVVATDGDDHDGISWAANALSLNGGTIKFTHTDVAEQVDADLDHAAQAALPGHKVEAAKPRFVEASVNGTALTVTFSEDLDTTAAPANSAFTVKKGSGGTAQTLSSTAPSISGSTVTLTLATASAVTATDTDVKVAYTKPSANPLKDLSGKEMDTFADQDVINQLADSVPPVLAATDAAVLAADGVTLTLTYNEALKTASVPAVAAFTVEATPAGGSEAAVALASSDAVTVSGSTVVLKLAVPITHNDGSVKVTYAKPATGAVIEDANGNDAAGFTDRAVTNNSVAPRVSIERVHADASSLIANPVFLIRRSNTATASLDVELSVTQTDTYVGLSDTSTVIASGQTEKEFIVDLDYPGNTNGDLTVTVTEGVGYAPALAPNDAATVAIKAPAAGRPLTVVHDQADWTVDEGDNARVTMTLTLAGGLADPRDDYDLFINLETGTATAQEPGGSGGDFIVPATGARTPVLASGWTASGGGFTQTVTLDVETVEDTAPEGEEEFRAVFNVSSEDGAIEYPALPDPNVDPTPPNDRVSTITITDDDPLVVTDVKVSSTPTASYYGVGDTIKFTVTFNGAVAVTGMPQFAFELAGQTRQAAYTGEDEEAAQTFEYTVASTDADDHDGISWGANAVGLNGGAITLFVKDGTPPDADLDHAAQAALPGQKVDAAKPAFVEASVNGTTLTVTFSEDLNTTAAPANSAFTVKKGSGGTAQTLSSTAPSISGRTVTLTLASAVTATDTDVKVAYTKPSANPLKDLSGKEMDTFGDQDVTNELADQVPPELATTGAAVLAADGVTLTLTYNEALKTSSVPDNSVFTVEATPAGGSEAAVALASSGGVTVSGSTVVLKLAVPIAHNDSSVKVTYAKPATGAVIEDANGNDAAGFTDRAVTNNSAVPRVSIERVYADASPGIAHAEFRVTRSNTSANALTVNIEITQADTYLASTTETITIPANATSMTEQFESYYEGNTSGDLTATVSGGDGYVPAVAPNNAATVRMKVPSSGRTLTIAHQQGAYSVTEGSDWSVTVTFSTGVGVAQPRQDVQAGLSTESGTAMSGSGNDFRTYGTTVTVAASDWTAAGGAFTATKAATQATYQDDEYEGSEQFGVRLHRHNPSTVPAFFAPTCPPGTLNGTTCLATITITDDDTLKVTDVEVTSTPTGNYYDTGESIDFEATFNGEVNVTGFPDFTFELGGETRRAGYAVGASSTTVLGLRYVVATGDADDHDGISWGANALGLNGGTIKFRHTDVAQQVNANLNHAAQGALPGQKVDTTKPSLEEAEVDGATLSMFFSEELNTAAPANSAFTVKVDAGTGANPTAVSISGSVVTLTLATAVTQEQTVTVTETARTRRASRSPTPVLPATRSRT